MIAVMIALDAVLYPLETDYEPWYYFFFMWFFVLVTAIGLVLSFYWRNKFTTSKKEKIFSYILLASGLVGLIFLFVDQQKYLVVGAVGAGFMIIGITTLLSAAFGLRKKIVLPSSKITRIFPKAIRPSAETVVKRLKRDFRLKTLNIVDSNLYYPEFDKVFIPDTINIPDVEYKTTDFNDSMIYYCLQTRNRDGHIREKYVKIILDSDCPHWAIPFIIEASTDRVVEIVTAIYDGISEKLKNEIGNYYINNLKKFRHDYSKTISYWNEYYRKDYPKYEDYPGYKLFTEVYGFKKRYYKEAEQLSGQSKKWNKLWSLYAEGKLEEIPFLLCNYYSGVMGEGHGIFMFNIENQVYSNYMITDYVEKLKGILSEGLYNNLTYAVNAFKTKKEVNICSLADDYFYEHEEEFIEILKRYADDLGLDKCTDNKL